jgi:transposase-like protein
MESEYGVPMTNASVYNWLIRYSKQAKEKAENYKPNVGDAWVCDETMLDIGGKKVWFWDLIDAKTRFLLASHISTSRTTKDAQVLVEKAAKRAGKSPKVIITDKLAAYLDGIELAFGSETKHIAAKKLTSKVGTHLIERFHGILKDRTAIMRGMKQITTAQILLDGWLIHYNFFRPHDSLKGKTPAEAAGIKFYKNWEAIVRSNKPIIEISESDKYRPAKHYHIHLAKRTVRRARRRLLQPGVFIMTK